LLLAKEIIISFIKKPPKENRTKSAARALQDAILFVAARTESLAINTRELAFWSIRHKGACLSHALA
jgi:hypothetical protein